MGRRKVFYIRGTICKQFYIRKTKIKIKPINFDQKMQTLSPFLLYTHMISFLKYIIVICIKTKIKIKPINFDPKIQTYLYFHYTNT